MARDNFSKTTKQALAKRVGFRCSFPGCNAVTSGPSSESSSASINTGEAAHISAASGGINSRRYDPNMTPKQRSAIENGIWCCNTHAKLIDGDELTYTIPMLNHWRTIAERRAQIRQSFGDIDLSLGHIELKAIGLAPETISLNSSSSLNQDIGVAIRHACIADISGKDIADTLRDFLVEYVRNALTHGNATEASITIEKEGITVVDKGSAFLLTRLLDASSQGGGMAYRALLETSRIGSISSRRTEAGENNLHIPFVVMPKDLPRINPCAINISHEQVHDGKIDISSLQGCDRVYLIAPDFSVYSDAPLYEEVLRQIITDQTSVTIVFPDISERVFEHFKATFAPANIVKW